MLPRTGSRILGAASRIRAAPQPMCRSRAPLRRQFTSRSPVRQQPAFHSQLQDANAAAIFSSLKTGSGTPQTLVEKIFQRHAVGLPEGKVVRSGDYVTIKPEICMSHDNSAPILSKFKSIGATSIHDPKQIVMALDHDVQNKSESNLKKYRTIEEFAKEQGVQFYPAGRGIGHQVVVEEFHVWPGTLAVASDSHSNHYGGIGALGTAIVRTDAASIWSTGKTWMNIPPVAKITFAGTLPTGVTGKDVIVALAGLFNNDEVLNHALEFTGSEETMRSLPVDTRLTISNMTTEWGALAALFPIDDILKGWLRAKATDASVYGSLPGSDSDTASRIRHDRLDELFANPPKADSGARYAKELFLDLSTLSPYVSGPNSVKVATPLHELAAQNIKVDRAYLVSCTNSRASDIAAAAKVFKDAAEKNGGKIPRIAEGVSLYIAAASLPEQIAAEEAGDWQALLDAGATALPSGCGPCIGLGTGLLQPGEVGVSASNRNFKGRMGSTDAKAYLASPEVVAASALHGKIVGPGWYAQPEGWTGVRLGEGDGIREEDRMLTTDQALDKIIGQLDSLISTAEAEHGEPSSAEEATSSGSQVEVLEGFPEKISGEIVFCDADNLSTDGVYPGSLTYKDDVSTEEMAEACMQNYDPEFKHIAKANDILVSGRNFGTGSSREQAATAILAKKIPLVVAASFGSIFSRNSINNALMGLEVPKLVERLREAFGAEVVKKQQSEVKEPEGNSESLYSVEPGPVTPAEKVLTRRTGWTLTWDVKRSTVEIQEGENGKSWSEKVGELPANVQEIIAKGGLEKWVKAQISS